jgi:hypothetical protein
MAEVRKVVVEITTKGSENATENQTTTNSNDETTPKENHTYLIYIPGARGYIDHNVDVHDAGWFSDDYYLELDILCDGRGEEVLFEFSFSADEFPDDFRLLFNGKKGSIQWYDFKKAILEY